MRENFDQTFHLEVEIPNLSCAMHSCRFVQICFLDSSPFAIIPFVYVFIRNKVFSEKHTCEAFTIRGLMWINITYIILHTHEKDECHCIP